jgi:hypothetical protein
MYSGVVVGTAAMCIPAQPSPLSGLIEEMRASNPALSLLQDDRRRGLPLPVFVEMVVPQEGVIIVFLCLVLMVLCM